MSKGTYLGGSTVIQANLPRRAKPKAKGLLSLEVEFNKTGKVAPQRLATPQAAKKKRVKEQRPPASGQKGVAHSAVENSGRVTAKRDPKPTPFARHSPRYSAAEISKYLLQHHPNCTGVARKRVANIADKGSWTGMATEEVVASCMEHYLLHEVCGLPQLIDFGLARPEALKLVAPQVKAVLGLWGARPVWLK